MIALVPNVPSVYFKVLSFVVLLKVSVFRDANSVRVDIYS